MLQKRNSEAASRLDAFSQHGLANLPAHNAIMIVIVDAFLETITKIIKVQKIQMGMERPKSIKSTTKTK